MAEIQDGRPISAGYRWRQRVIVTADEPVFPVGSTFRAQVRAKPNAPDPALATLTTANGGIVRVDDDTIDLVISGDVTADFPVGSVFLDLVRTDGDEPDPVGVRLEIPVIQPVTRSDP